MKKRSTWPLLILLVIAVLIGSLYVISDHASADRTAPEITMDSAEILLSVGDPESALLQGVTARDDKDGDLTDAIVIENLYGMEKDGRISVTYAVSDRSGNVSKAERTACYTDYHSPRFELTGPLVFPLGGTWDVMASVTATDVFDGDIQRRIKAAMLSAATTVTEEGTHDVRFQVTNSIGDTTQIVLPVEVYPSDSYNAVLTLKDYLVYLPLGGEIDLTDYPVEFETPSKSMELRGGIPDDLRLRITGFVDPDTPGVYPVGYTATYSAGGFNFTGYTKLLVVVEGKVEA